MSVPEIIEAIAAAGATLKTKGGKPHLAGEVPEAVLEAIRANRDAVLEAWGGYERDRWDKCPPDSVPLRTAAPHWRPEVYRRVERYVRHQSDTVVQWAFQRTCRYRESGMEVTDACKAALMDVLQWQLTRVQDPVRLLQDLDEVVRDWKDKQANGSVRSRT